MNNYRLPPRNAAEQQQRNAQGPNTRKSNFTILSQDMLNHPSGVNSELAGNMTSAFGSKSALDGEQDASAATKHKNYYTTEELEPIEANPGKKFKLALENLVTSADWNVQFDACNEIRRVCKFH